jgi:hypothetical protein
VLSTEAPFIWRIGSIAGGALGAAASLIALTRAASSLQQRLLGVASLLLFLAVLAAGFVFEPIFGLKPILVEALIDCVILGLGVWQAWIYMMEPGGQS